MKQEETPLTFKSSLLTCTFGFPVIYWCYLFFTCQTIIVWDSIDYQNLGSMLYHQSWIEFFKSGPHREPLYPLFISASMRIADFFNTPYLKILVIMQFALLLLTQIFTLKILQKLKVRPFLTALIILYIGFSPALINCSLSLYSEIFILPLIPATALILSHIFDKFTDFSLGRCLWKGFLLGIMFILLTLVKGIFELATPLIILSSLLILKHICKNKNILKHHLTIIIVSLLTFLILLFTYKSVNKHYNGNFTVTNRGAWALYGFAARRTEPMTTQRFLTALAYVPGEGACKMLFDQDKCYFWSFYSSDNFGMGKLKEINDHGFTGAAADKEMIRLAIEKIKINPFQYFLMTGLEGLKIFFWESTKLAFVTYPHWLTKIYDLTFFKNILRLFWAGLSVAGLIYTLQILLGKQAKKTKLSVPDEQFITLFFTVSIIFSYTAIYSLFLLGTRYALPLAPLFLILIAVFLQRFQKP